MEICKNFYDADFDLDDDILSVAEDMMAIEGTFQCIYPNCKKMNATGENCGLCPRHLRTQAGRNVQKKLRSCIIELAPTETTESYSNVNEAHYITEDYDDEEDDGIQSIDEGEELSVEFDEDEEGEDQEYKTLGLLKLGENKYKIHPVQNEYGQRVHQQTGIIFSTKTGMAYGHEGEGGLILPLNESDIEFCRKYNFRYKSR